MVVVVMVMMVPLVVIMVMVMMTIMGMGIVSNLAVDSGACQSEITHLRRARDIYGWKLECMEGVLCRWKRKPITHYP